MKGRRLSQNDYHVGQRVVSGRDPKIGLGLGPGEHDLITYRDMRVETVEAIDEDARRMGTNARMVLRHGDEVRTVLLCHTGIDDRHVEDTGWRTLWSEPLPEDDHAAIALASAIHSTNGYRDISLFWIAAAAEDGICYAHMLTDAVSECEEIPIIRSHGALSYTTVAVALRCPVEAAPRSVIAVRLEEARAEGGRVIHCGGHATVIMTDVDLDIAAGSIPIRTQPPGIVSAGNIAGWSVLDDAEGRALALEEASEALTLCWDDGGTRGVTCLAKTGIDFWKNDDPEAYAETTIPGPGLWMWRNVRYRSHVDHEGVWDGDMQGEWHPATTKDVLAMAGSLDAVADDIRHYTGEWEDDPVSSQIAMARSRLPEALAA